MKHNKKMKIALNSVPMAKWMTQPRAYYTFDEILTFHNSNYSEGIQRQNHGFYRITIILNCEIGTYWWIYVVAFLLENFVSVLNVEWNIYDESYITLQKRVKFAMLLPMKAVLKSKRFRAHYHKNDSHL